MILMTLVALLVLQAPVPPREPRDLKTSRASIEGVVVRAGSGEPLARAQVTLIRIGDGARDPGSSTPAPPSTITDASGRFVLRNLEPGSYRIAVARNGYARQEYGQRVFGGQGTVVALAAGQAFRDIAFHLTPTGAVTGVVRDASGEPLVGAHVQLLRSSYNTSGQRAIQAAGGDRTNDRGEYRVYWITPGRYFVAVSGAAPGRSVPAPSGVGSLNEIVEQRYPTSYYPGTTDVGQASVVDVAPGAELTTVDIVVPEEALFRVSGSIVDPITERHPPAATVSVVARGPAGTSLGVSGTTQSYNPATGTFTLTDVPPGSYWIRAIVAASSAESILPPEAAGRTVADVFADSLFAGRQVAQAPLDLFGNADDVVLALWSGVPIRGVVRVDGQPLSAVTGFERIEVTLSPAARGLLTNPSRHEPLGLDGAFTLPNVLPGEYVVTVHALPPGYYVKEARAGNADALERPLLVSGPSANALNVVLSPNGGRIDGIVVNDRRQPLAGIEAVLLPARQPARVDLYKTAITNSSGAFIFHGIPPGDYKVFAWEAIESFGYFDENLLRQSDPQGATVRIEESAREQVEVRIIPARFQ
jgi:Carboxypeptidase regulatory-like domain